MDGFDAAGMDAGKQDFTVIKNLSSPIHWSWHEGWIICILLILAIWLRAGQLKQSVSRPLDPDPINYLVQAEKIKPFTDTGFYSARFGMREPLYLMVVKCFLWLPGPPELNIRYVSLFFSLFLIFLTYLLTRGWMGKAVGFIAAFLLTFHTYFIELSVQGYRCEFFTCLFLLFVYWALIKDKTHPMIRTIGTGILSGLLFLTRTEFLFPVILFFLVLPLITKKYWGFLRAGIAIAIGMIIFIPHLAGMYRVHGEFFYTNHMNARFFTNLEFAGQPGFPSLQDIEKQGMYVGPKITPLEYFFRFHTLPELTGGTLWGFIKSYISLAFRYIPTQKRHLRKGQGINIKQWIKSVVFQHPFLISLGILVGISFVGGLCILWKTRFRALYVILVLFQLHTAFLVFVGLDIRIVIHTWPVALWVAAFFVVNYINKLGIRWPGKGSLFS